MDVAIEGKPEKFILEKREILEDSEDEFEYGSVTVDEDYDAEKRDEELLEVEKKLKEVGRDEELCRRRRSALPSNEFLPALESKPEAVDDFVRNFLFRMDMKSTLHCFQTEWYRKVYEGTLKPEDAGIVPDVYRSNRELNEQVKQLRDETERHRQAALQARDTFGRLRKERDHHKMRHSRLVQEKQKLLDDIKRIKEHYATYAPAMQQLQSKYDETVKQKMLTQLERDRAVEQARATLQAATEHVDAEDHQAREEQSKATISDDKEPAPAKTSVEQLPTESTKPSAHARDSSFGPNTKRRGSASVKRAANVGPSLRETYTFEAHDKPITGLAVHPQKEMFASTSDDGCWKLWSLREGRMIMSGQGHSDWLSDCHFHPSGNRLATSSGDATIKIWDFSRANCIHTFRDFNVPVWGCCFHFSGNFLAGCCMDGTTRIFDMNSLRSRFILRGHKESVNSAEFQKNSNILITSSADKTAILWDARTAISVMNLQSHQATLNHATFSQKGNTVATCDAFGTVKLWDTRKLSELRSFDDGPHSSNKLAFDPSGSVLICASSDGLLHVHDLSDDSKSSLTGHADSVQATVFTNEGDMIMTGSTDRTIKLWA